MQKGNRIKVGLIGLGSWGGKIATTIRKDIPGFTLHRSASTNLSAKKMIGPQCILHSNWNELLNNDDIDALILAIPPRFNCEITKRALKAGIPVFIEKPMTTNTLEAHEILKVAQENNGIAEVDHIDLFNPAFRKMKKCIDKPIQKILGRIGASYEPRNDIKPLWEYAPHFIAAIITLIEKMPVAVKGKNLPRETPPFDDPSKEIIGIHLGFDDSSEVYFEAGNGMKKKERFLDIFLENEIFHFEDRANSPLSRSDRSKPATKIPISLDTDIQPLTAALQSFETKVRVGRTDTTGLVMGLKVVTMLEGLTKSLETKKWCPISYSN
jgi:predicted dehydrogenase